MSGKCITFERVLAVMLLCYSSVTFAQADATLDDLNEMEQRANKARSYYWSGDVDAAIKTFRELTSTTHPSSSLYLNELGMSYLAVGNDVEAERCFREVALLLATYTDSAREQEALSNYGKEEAKIYRGDPYEQATSYLLLALLFLNKGDYDNALAACKSGALCDSDATENMYDSDYTLLHAVESKCHLLRGDVESSRVRRDLAAESFRITSSEVRDLFSERTEALALLRTPGSDRRKLRIKDSDDVLNAKLAAIDHRLRIAAEGVDGAAALGSLYSGEFNTLIVVPCGSSPRKARKGRDAQLVFFERTGVLFPELAVFSDDEEVRQEPIRDVADIDFQATTRGGRQMDAILNGKAAFRSTTVGVGSALVEAGNNLGGSAGLVAALLGAAVQGMGGAVTPEADTRCWQTLPHEFVVYALNLPQGEHSFVFRQFVYFESMFPVTRKLEIAGPNDVAVVFAPPSCGGVFSEICQAPMKLSKRDTSQAANQGAVIVTPPLRLHRLERFKMNGGGDRPEAFAPDGKRVMRCIKKALGSRQISSYLVTHEQIVNNRPEYSRKSARAFQFALGEMSFERKGRTKTYSVRCTVDIVDTHTGTVVYTDTATGVCSDSKTTTEAFYACVVNAVNTCASSDLFMTAVNLSASTASAMSTALSR